MEQDSPHDARRRCPTDAAAIDVRWLRDRCAAVCAQADVICADTATVIRAAEAVLRPLAVLDRVRQRAQATDRPPVRSFGRDRAADPLCRAR